MIAWCPRCTPSYAPMLSTVRSPCHGGESRLVTSCTTLDAISAAGLPRSRSCDHDRRFGGGVEQLVHGKQRSLLVDDCPRPVAGESVEHAAVPHHVGGGLVDGHTGIVA